MRIRAILLVGFLAITSAVYGQTAATSSTTTTVERDAQAANLLSQSVAAALGLATSSSFSDFTATGTITFNWGNAPVQGSVTVMGRAPDQFRLDAVIPDGTRSWAVSHGWGALRDTNGTVTKLPYHNTVNLGIVAFPYPTLAAALADPLTTVTYVGQVNSGGHVRYQIRIQRNLPSQSDPGGDLSALCVTDYFIDSQTYLIDKTVDMTHPEATYTEKYTHEIDLEGYITVSGYQVPTVVREKISNQTTWEIHLTKFTFNTGLTDSNFAIQ